MTVAAGPALSASPTHGNTTRRRRAWRWIIVVAAPMAILVLSVPAGVTPQGWRLLAIFVGTIFGLILQPLPMGAMALLGVAALAFTGTLTAGQALAGYADPLVWMVFAAFCIARGMIKTGLGRRIAFLFIRAFGGTSIGLAYSVVATDTLLGTVIPSNGARAGGIVFPIVKSLAEAYESTPGPTSARLGTFLMLVVFHCDVTVSAMFFTGQASNPLISALAAQVTGIEIGYAKWALAAIAPAAVSMIVVPFLLFRLVPPTVRRTPAAATMAETELAQLGPRTRSETVMFVVFVLLMLLWITKAWHGVDYPVVALLGLGILLVTGVLEWSDVLAERGAWDTLVWYGGIFQMARALGESGVIKAFAGSAALVTGGFPWWTALAALVVVYFYAHYAFASISAHVSAMFVPFLVVVLAGGAPVYAAVLTLAFLSTLGASLTHYGTTTSPIYFGAGYTSQAGWWRIGLIVATANAAVWCAVGLLWWKLLGWW
jgi:DASS family divalent anion:Na+ symporter